MPILQADPGQAPIGPGAGPTPTPTSVPMTGGVPSSDLSTNLTTVTTAAPDLKTDPGTAVAVAAGGGDVALKAQGVQTAKDHVAQAHAATSMAQGGLFGDITSGLGKDLHDAVNAGKSLVGGAAHLMNVPLRTVQQEYRYLHDVEALHGRQAAIEEGVGLLLGAAAGTVVDPGEGTILGADAAGWLEGHLQYKDSWARAANPNYRDPHTGQLVSFGRDIVSEIDRSAMRKNGQDGPIAGALDAVFDMGADPVANVGKIYGEAHALEGVGQANKFYGNGGGLLGNGGGLLGNVLGGTSTATAEDIARASILPRVKIAYSFIARSNAAEITQFDARLEPMALTLEHDKTAEQVQQTFMELAGSMEMMKADTLPTMSLTHLFGRGVRNMARNADGTLGYIPRSIADALESQPGNTLSTDTMDFMHGKVSLTNDSGVKDLYRWFRFGLTHRESIATVDAYLHAIPGQRLTIIKNGVYKTLLAMANEKAPDLEKYPDLGEYMEELGRGDVKQRVMEGFANNVQQAMVEGGDKGRIYGTDELGNRIEGPVMPDGSEIAAGITSDQTGDVSLPNLVEARRMAQAIKSNRVHKVLAGFDDFAYNYFTQKIWKPLELTSLSYALHIALAEIIPNVLRDGIVKTVGAMNARVLGNMGYEAEARVSSANVADTGSELLDKVLNSGNGEAAGLAGWLWRMGGKRLVENSDQAQAAMKTYALMEGNHSPIGLAAGEMTIGETQPVLKAENALKQTAAVPGNMTDDWTQVGSENSRYAELHRASFRRSANCRWSPEAAGAYLQAAREGKSAAEGTIAARNAVVDALRDEPPEVLSNYGRNYGKRLQSPQGWDNTTDWADSIVSRMKGVVHGRPTDIHNQVPGPINMDLLHSMANGHTPPIEVFDKLTTAERPLRVEGQIINPRASDFLARFANGWFRKVVNPVVDAVSRNQEFMVEYQKQYKDLQKAVDNGTISDDERVVMATYRSAQHGVRFVHNLTDRTQWTTTLRNWAPFYFAQEQAYRRMGRFLVEDPGGFRRYQMAISAVSNVANTYADGSGNQYIVFPGSGWLGKGAASAMGLHGLMVGTVAPAMFGGSLSSANVIFPMSNGITPDVGPMGSLAAQTLITQFEHLGKTYASFSPVANVAVSALNAVDGNQGSYNDSVMEQLIPNETLLRGWQLYEAYHGTGGGEEGFNSAILQTYNMLDYMQNEATAKWIKDGSKGQPPVIVPTQQQALDDPHVAQVFAQKVKNYVTTLYVMRTILGFVSPVSAEVEPQNFGFSAKLQDAINKEGSVAKGFTKFLTEFPEATPYTVADSFVPNAQGQPTGISISSSVPAQDWVVNHQAQLNNYGPAYLWLMPQLSNAKYSSTVYNEQVADGLRQRETPEQHLDQLYIAAGDAIYYKNLTVFENALDAAGNDSSAKNTEYNTWNTFVAQLGKTYPIWYENFTSGNPEIQANQAISTLNKVFADGNAPPGTQTDGVKVLLNSYDVASTEYNQAGTGGTYSAQLSAQSKVNDAWVSYLQTTAVSYPALKPVIQSVFMHALKPPANG